MLSDNDKANRWIDKIAEISDKVAVARKANVVQTAIATVVSVNASDYTVRLLSSPDDGSQDFNVVSKTVEQISVNDPVMLHYVGDLTNAYIAMPLDSSGDISAYLVQLIQSTVNTFVLDKVYPVGSIYTSVNSTSPQTLFTGTTWERITGKFLLAATDGGSAGGNSTASVVAGGTGGEASHVLSVAELAQHGHRVHVWDNAGTMANAWYYNGATKTTHTGARLYNAGSSTWIASGSTANAASSGQGDPSGGTNLIGSSTAHNNMPPYLSVYVWKRTA